MNDARAQTTLAELGAALGAGALLTGKDIGPKYHVDFTGDHPQAPAVVIRPASTEQLATVLRQCHAIGQPVVIQGGMTGLAGGATPQPGEWAISLERMSGIEELDPISMTVTAWAGTPLETVQQAAAEAGLLFPLDMGARGSCTVGGNIATNAGGNEVIRFGMARNLVLGLEVVLADGTILSSLNKMLKNNAGYDLKQLFIGSEGTLGVVTRAVLRLLPRLPSRCTALCAVANFPAAVELLHALQSRLRGSLSAFELMWANYYDCVLDITRLRSPFDARHALYLLIETEGADQQADQALFDETLAWALDAKLLEDAVIAQSERDVKHFWEIRDGIGEITPRLHPALVFDVSLPINVMERFLAEVDTELGKAFTAPINLMFGHIGDNNLHLVTTTGRQEDLQAIGDIVYRVTGAHGGSVSGEHGIGTLRLPYLHYSRSPAELALMRSLKRCLDPRGILNPGRVIA